MIRLVLKLWKTHTHPCCCVYAKREQEGRAVQTAQKGPAVWEVSAKIASWRPLHHSQNTWLLPLSLSSLKDFSGGGKNKLEMEVLIWILTFTHLLVSFFLCSVSSLLPCSAWFFFSFFLSIYPVRLSFSLCLSIVLSLWFFLLMMSLDWSLSDAHKAKHSAGFLPPLMWHWSIEMHTASMVKP